MRSISGQIGREKRGGREEATVAVPSLLPPGKAAEISVGFSSIHCSYFSSDAVLLLWESGSLLFKQHLE